MAERGAREFTAAEEQILEERARTLARPLEEAEGDDVDLVIMSVDGARYAVDVRFVEGIHSSVPVARVPGASEIWKGIVNLRGNVYPVLDLSLQLGMRKEQEGPGRAIVLVSNGQTVAVLIDDMPKRKRVYPTDLKANLGGGDAFVRALTPDLISVLDVERILEDSVSASEPKGEGDSR